MEVSLLANQKKYSFKMMLQFSTNYVTDFGWIFGDKDAFREVKVESFGINKSKEIFIKNDVTNQYKLFYWFDKY